jgi:glycosyltransferase involved in cell wall biosynthesis
VDVLIEAVKNLPDVSLTIVGTGHEERSLHLATCNFPHISITSHIDDLASFYRSLDAFVLPSREHDPFGLVAGEAMMLGIPVIVTDACGIAGYLTNGCDAVITPCGSVEALRTAILDMKKAPEKCARMSTIGKRTAEEKFSMENMVKKYEEMLS